MATMMYPTLTKSQSMRAKRKSAVELLAESKPFYVKSEIVRDTTQALPTRPNPNFGSYGTYNRSKSVNMAGHGTNYRPTTLPQYMAVSPSRSLPPLTPRRAVLPAVPAAGGELLQTRLRRLLASDESLAEQAPPLSPPAEYAAQPRCHKSLPDLHLPGSNKSSSKSLSNRDSGGSSGRFTQRSEPAPPPRQDARRDSGSSTQHSGASPYYCCQEAECRGGGARPAFPPPSAFKRQKCLRYKRDRPILRSKSDVGDRHWRAAAPPPQPEPPAGHLQQFFEHLGLTIDSYEEMLSNSGSSENPVFFSDVSTVDSSRPIDNIDYCPSSYRSSEPPSIVERNARIIKWLCNCRKLQLA